MNLYAAIDRHAQQALQCTAGRFDAYLKQRCSEQPYCLESHGHKLAADNLSLRQQLASKLFGRIYSLSWNWSVPMDLGQCSMDIHLAYRGWRRKTRQALFVGKNCPPRMLDMLNHSEVLRPLCLAMELGGLEIRYRAQERRCEAMLRPNYGDFIWLLMPPLKYIRQPSVAEVDSTMLLIHELSTLLRNSIEKPLRGHG
ncbi:hypothetical protein GV819_05495 [Pseudomonas sp. Fl5BN2]|uniref:hypothetical protein n=1 Tax=unclassified Pseudomonas TaxID=196821 RepID=UPI0013780D72|nr:MULTISPECIES: hypothetical protein [unclassified Pseudomonas]NBF01739.1 hypothetical protein [Pseudomonas sp. Fl5BN2]NBF07241.1 hypothetical protein [Pseudomonas sp. Fl4BN1]